MSEELKKKPAQEAKPETAEKKATKPAGGKSAKKPAADGVAPEATKETSFVHVPFSAAWDSIV